MSKVALVTGASRGIGRVVALRLAQAGYKTAVCYHQSRDEALELVNIIQSQGYIAQAFQCDVADADSVSALAQSVSQQLGEVSVLINNAGIAQQKLFTDLSNSDWEGMIGVHLTGTFHTCRAFLPAMIRQHEGVIVNISSMWGQIGGSCETHYSAAKAGVIGLTKALAKEVGPSGIRVNCVAPGVIQTDMMKGFDEAILNSLVSDTPLMRLGTTEDVANAVMFLVSEESSFITGQVIAPNGGMVI